jgi:D-xylose transport system substrate-binding protein
MKKLVAIAILLGACKAPDKAPDVAFLLSTLQEERYQKDMHYFEAKAQSLGLTVTTLAADNDNAKQVSEVEDALTRGAKVLVIQPTDTEAASRYVEMAHEHGAKVIAYDRSIDAPDLDYYVAHDSYHVGVLQAQAAIAATGGKGKFVILSGQAGHSVATEITKGYDDTLAPYVQSGAIEIVARQNHSAWSPEQAMRTVEDAIAKGPVDAILANNSGMARGAVQAVEAAGLKHVFIAGADADAANVNFVCSGEQSVEVLKDVRPLAETAAQAAADLIAGKALDGNRAAVPVELVTPDNVKQVGVDSGFLTSDEIPACAGKLADLSPRSGVAQSARVALATGADKPRGAMK